MADLQPYQRQVSPDARLSVPSAPNPWEEIGRATQDLGAEGGQAAYYMARAQRNTLERDWEKTQPLAAKAIAQAGLDGEQFYADARAKAPEDLAGFQDQVGKWWDDKAGELKKTVTATDPATAQRLANYIDIQTTDMKSHYIGSAISDATTAGIATRVSSIQKTLDISQNQVASNPALYGPALSNVLASIDSQNIGAAKKEELKKTAQNGLSYSAVSGQIAINWRTADKALNSGAWDSSLDPKDKIRLEAQVNAASKEEDYQALKAQAAADRTAVLTASRNASDLEIGIERGTKGYPDIEAAYNSKDPTKQISPAVRTQLTVALDARAAKDAKAQASLVFVQSALAGQTTIDPKNSEQMNAVDDHFLQSYQSWTQPQTPPDAPQGAATAQPAAPSQADIDALTTQYVTKLGVVPKSLQGQLRGELRSGTGEQQVHAANMIETFRQQNPALLNDFAPEDIQRAIGITSQVQSGVTPQNAIQNVHDAEKVDATTKQARGDSYLEATKPPNGVPRFDAVAAELKGQVNTWAQRYLPGVTNPDVPVEMVAQYDNLKKQAFIRTNDMETSQKFAADTIKRTWGVSSINGAPKWMSNPPENFYAAPPAYGLSQADNSAWMKDELVKDFTANSIIDTTAGDARDRLSIVPDISGRRDAQGRPVYTVMFQQSTGQLLPAVDAQGNPLAWQPDWDSSETKARLDAGQAANLAHAKAVDQSGAGASIPKGNKYGGMAPAVVVPPVKAVPAPAAPSPAVQPDALTPGDMVAPPSPAAAPGNQSSLTGPQALVRDSIKTASIKELRTLVSEAKADDIKSLAAAELKRRGA
jgi:hypothetical protein